MTRINPVNPETATGKAKELLDGVKAKLGFVPNMMATFAVSPAALESYLVFSGAAAHTLDAKLREQIALTVAETNGCHYCASAHTAIGKMVGLAPDAILNARKGTSADAKTRAALQLARAVALSRGEVSQAEYNAALEAGLTEKEIIEVVVNVALNYLTNAFNNLAKTSIDFPKIDALSA